jgi:beta-xylosidase
MRIPEKPGQLQEFKGKFEVGISKFLIFSFGFTLCVSGFTPAAAQEGDLEFTVDAAANTVPLPNIFQPNIDLSGRGAHSEPTWPQVLAAKEALDIWQKDIGFTGIYRLQFTLWEISQLAKDKDSQDKLLGNYERIIKSISDSGGTVILNIFSMPPGLGKVLDKKSAPWDLKAFKELIRGYIRELSCNKKYKVWYEVWSAPDLDEFFVGGKQEYLDLYRAVAESARELETETKIDIPVGGPGVSWWFQSFDGNNILEPEKSLIYELIKFCSEKNLPLDFITWHAYSSGPKTEKEVTAYNKPATGLIREWLTYFNLDSNIPLVIDEWNYDSGANLLPARHERSFISASYIPARIKNMHGAGIDYQLFFSLEDFKENKEGVIRNTGIFWFDQDPAGYKGGPKAVYNIFRMLKTLGKDMYPVKPSDEFCGAIATKTSDGFAVLIYNYIDPEIFMNCLSAEISLLAEKERRPLLNIIKSGKLDKIIRRELDVSRLALSKKAKDLLRKALDLNDKAAKFKEASRNIKLNFKNLKENYLYERYIVNSLCSANCEFKPSEEKEITPAGIYQEALALEPYSVNLIILKTKPKPSEVVIPVPPAEEPPQTQAEPAVKNETAEKPPAGAD